MEKDLKKEISLGINQKLNSIKSRKQKMEKIELEKDDIAILVKPDGTSQVFIPFRDKGENELSVKLPLQK